MGLVVTQKRKIAMISKTKTISRTVRYGQGVERPCHFVGKLFLAAKEDNYALTIDDIVDWLSAMQEEKK